ncbi:MAG: autotransporter domain-containing protein [Caulobacteraceae bacterium]
MRKALVAAVALAPLCFVASRTPANAQQNVSNGLNAPIFTATSTNGAPGDITIESGGSVTVTGATPAVTLNSSNNVTIDGSVSISNVNNSTAVQLQGGNTGNFENDGTITNSESFSASTNSNGFIQEPFAQGSGRIGLQVSGTAPLVGNVENDNTISVQGNNSYGVSIEAPITGAFTNTGTITLVGDGGAAVRSTAAGSISGNFVNTGSISVQGAASNAVNLEGSVGGSVSIYGPISATAFAVTQRPTDTGTLQSIEGGGGHTIVPGQLEEAGAAVIIGGSVGHGIFIGAPPVGTLSTSTADVDGDGIIDSVEGTGSITNIGNGAALQIGSVGTNITIGEFGTTNGEPGFLQPANAFGLIIRGSVAGIGTFDGVEANALQIGTGDGTVNIEGGVRVVGSVTADSFDANATAIHILSGGTVPAIQNEDFIEASVTHSILVTSPDPSTATATAILVEAGGTLNTITNYGTIQASVIGDNMSAVTIKDNNTTGGVTNILNEGVISATVNPENTGDVTTGKSVAIDLSANSSGVTLIQKANPTPIAVETTTTTDASGQVTTTAAFTSVTASASATTTTTTTVTTTGSGVTTTTTTTTPTTPEIIGDVLLGNGTNNVQLIGGSIIGALSMGSGAGDAFTIGDSSSSGSYVGALTYSGSSLAINVVNGTLENTATGTLKLSSLNVGSQGVLFAAIDPQNSSGLTNTLYQVNGQATIANGGQLGIVLKSPLFNETSFTIIQATSLTNNASDALVLTQVPFVLVGTATTNTANGTVTVDLRRRTAAEAGLNPAQSAALNAIYSSLPNDSQIESAVLNQFTRSDFLGLYNQMLPDYSGGIYQLALGASDAVTRATSRVNDIENPSGTRGAWAEEVAFGIDRENSNSAQGYSGGGYGFVGGLETGGAGLGAFGLTGAFLTGQITPSGLPGDDLASFSEGEFGAYWQGQLGGFRADARVAGGYVLFSDRRELLQKDSAGDITLDRASKANSSGYTATGHFGLGYQTGQFGWFYFRPQVHADYFRLDQGSYTEHDGGPGFDLAVANRLGDQTSGTASLITGMSFGSTFKWRPELELGYRDVFTGTSGNTTASFTTAGSQPFTLPAPSIRGGGPIARVNVKADTDFYELNLEAGIEQRTDFAEGDVRFSVRVLF